MRCCVPYCDSDSRVYDDNTDNKRSMHEFPKHEDSRSAWINAIGRQGIFGKLWKPTTWSVVCSRHFTADSFKLGLKRRRLLPHAIPSIFENYPAHKQKLKVTKRREIVKCNSLSVSDNPEPERTSAEVNTEEILTVSENITPTDCQGDNLIILADACLAASRISFKKDAAVGTNVTLKKLHKKEKKHVLLKECLRRAKHSLGIYKKKVKQLKKINKTLNNRLLDINLDEIENAVGKGPKAGFFLEQLKCFTEKKHRWKDETVRYAILLHSKSPSAYNFLRETEILSLPSKSTLKRYVGFTSGQTVSSLMKQRLYQEASNLKSDGEHFGSLIIDEMSIKSKAIYNKHADEVIGNAWMDDLKDGDTELVTENKFGQLANRLLCFVFTGLSTKFRVPVAYYFTKSLKGEQLYTLTMNVLQEVESAGFLVLRIVTDNHSTNVKLFSLLSQQESALPVIPHPLNSDRVLFLSYDVCHILKNLRSLFLARQMTNDGKPISPNFIRSLYGIQKNFVMKPVRNLTRKHIFPSNLEKMHVGRAVRIFKDDVIGTLKFLQQHGPRFGFYQFKDATATIDFLQMVNRWFTMLNVKNTTYSVLSRNQDAEQFASLDDARLSWLKNDFLQYLEQWKESCTSPSDFLSKETYDAIVLTTKSAVSCIKYLLQNGFQYVLTRKFTSDEIEGLFSYVRRLSGSNDQTDALSAVQSLHKILVTGIVRTSFSGNVQSNDVSDNWMRGTLFPKQPSLHDHSSLQVENIYDLKAHLLNVQNSISSVTPVTIHSATIAFISGYLVFVANEKFQCTICSDRISTAASPSPLMALIKNSDRGGRLYPKPGFVNVWLQVENVVQVAVPIFRKRPFLLKSLSNLIYPYLSKNYYMVCSGHKNGHDQKMCKMVLHKFLRPYLSNMANAITDKNQMEPPTKLRRGKSRKILRITS